MVGIGASAGGLDAIKELFAALPSDTGMAFVVIQHLDPKHGSMASEILARTTSMPVREIKSGLRVKPNSVYAIPSNRALQIKRGVFKLIPRQEDHGQHMVIDSFFKSLADDVGEQAVGVILSGTATDGTLGLKAIKSAGGLALAQDPVSAKFDGMPKSAIASGVVDFILSPTAMGKELSRVAGSPSLLPKADAENGLRQLFSILRARSHVDFSHYKRSTVMRRIQRRMVVRRARTLSEYANYVNANPEESRALFDDLLINVTEFFRDNDSYKVLAGAILPKLLKSHDDNLPLRIWISGCSTGEEVYSIAILLLEIQDKMGKNVPIQIFGTDISEPAIQKARSGLYSTDIEKTVSKDRLKRFFEKVDGHYKITRAIRDLCLFSRHDVTCDPPFSRIDFISCRNVLIYFDNNLQRRVVPIFHYALNPGGVLWLGRSESPGENSKLFRVLKKTHRFYMKANIPTPPNIRFPAGLYLPELKVNGQKPLNRAKDGHEVLKIADRIALSRFAPPSVVVNSDLEILQFRGRTGPYLEPAAGAPNLNLLRMARPEVVHGLRLAMQTAKAREKSVRQGDIQLMRDGRRRNLTIEVLPLNPQAPAKQRTYLICFEEESATLADIARPLKSEKGSAGQYQYLKKIRQLEREVAANRQMQDSMAEEFEVTQEELTSANEELQSANEELQSTNEELETAKEELQSSNEELTTVNDELRSKNNDLISLTGDLNNVLSSVHIPIVIVNAQHRIHRFTPGAEKAFKLIASDIGRPVGDVKPNFEVDLESLVDEVTRTLTPIEQEIQDHSGHWFRLQVRPYRSVDNRIDGAVIALIDIEALKKSVHDAERANAAKDLFLATLSHELRTPLNVIQSWAQMLVSGKLDSAKIARANEMIQQNALALELLVDDLLDISRIILGKLSLNMTAVDPAKFIPEVIESLRPNANRKSVQIRQVFGAKPVLIMADPVRLKQILWNLVNNGIKFSHPGGVVEVHLDETSDRGLLRVNMSVVDHGIGISPKLLPQIFERFTQGESSRTREPASLGLGLAIVRTLVELHGGKIWAESPGEGHGATFVVEFPGAKVTDEMNISPTMVPTGFKLSKEDGSTEDLSLKDVKILLVDDDPDTRDVISIALESFGAQVKSEATVADALASLSNDRPDIIVSDIAMPGEDGYSFIKKLRSTKSIYAQIPTLALSAYADPVTIARVLKAGFSAHLPKPIRLKQMVKTIAQLAKNR